MLKSDLIPMKHILVARNKDVYWYVGDLLGKKTNLIACGSNINMELNLWDENFLADRSINGRGYWFHEPRLQDIIYIYEIIDMETWMEMFHKYEFIDYEHQSFMNDTIRPYGKLVWERVDAVFEEY